MGTLPALGQCSPQARKQALWSSTLLCNPLIAVGSVPAQIGTLLCGALACCTDELCC